MGNYEEQQPIYVKGNFRISEVRQLSADDYFTSGVLVQAYPVESVESGASVNIAKKSKRVFPNTVFEFVFPCIEVPSKLFAEGHEITVDSSRDSAAVLNIKRIDSDHLCFTALPLLYGTYPLGDAGSISLSPPSSLNIEASWPLSKELSPRRDAASATRESDEDEVKKQDV